MALSALLDGFPDRPAENKLVLIDPSGNVMWEYWKAMPVPGEPSLAGEGIIPTQDTLYGRIAAAIRFDMDFPGLIHKAGQAEADLMLAPSNDWPDQTVGPVCSVLAVIHGRPSRESPIGKM